MIPLMACHCSAEQGIQVIGAGVSRTSTQSLSVALTKLGFKTLHAEGFHPDIPMLKESPELVEIVTKAALKSFSDHDFAALAPALEKAESLGITALVDIPWSEYGVDLHRMYPKAKIIVTVREKNSWYKSYWEHFRWGALLPPPPFPSFPITQPFPLTVLYQPFAQYWRLMSQRISCGPVTRFPPWPLNVAEQQVCLEGFNEHNDALSRAIPPESLLMYNIREGWEPLCEFLSVPVPNASFPHLDAYSHIHWKASPRMFVLTAYRGYCVVIGYCVGIGLCCYSLTSLYCRSLSKGDKLD